MLTLLVLKDGCDACMFAGIDSGGCERGWGPELWSHLFSGKEVRMGGHAGELGGSGRSFCNRVLFLCGREGTPLAGSEWSSRTISSVVRCG